MADNNDLRIPDVIEVDERTATVDNVDFKDRIITVIACPYEQPTQVVYHNEPWNEVVSRSAFAGIQRKNNIRVNREHDRVLTVGKVTGYFPDRAEGLVIDTYIARTPLGQETLELARDGMLDGSVGMKVATSDQMLDRRNRVRRINKAFLDHFAFTADPAYEGAQVLSVRASAEGSHQVVSRTLPSIAEFYTDPMFQWADRRLQNRFNPNHDDHGQFAEGDGGSSGDSSGSAGDGKGESPYTAPNSTVRVEDLKVGDDVNIQAADGKNGTSGPITFIGTHQGVIRIRTEYGNHVFGPGYPKATVHRNPPR